MAPQRWTACSLARPSLPHLRHQMPRMDGMKLLRRLRQKSDLPSIFPHVEDEEIDELFVPEDGCRRTFIPSPFSQRLLDERVKAILRRCRQPRGLGRYGRCKSGQS